MFGEQFYPTPPRLAMRQILSIDWKDVNFVIDGQAGKGDLLDAVRFYRSYSFYDCLESPRSLEFDWDKFDEMVQSGEYAKAVDHESNRRGRDITLAAMEIDTNLQAVLRAKQYKVLGADFLTYDAPDQPDVFLMNPPFANGELFLLNAIDRLFSGQISCQLNAQTIKNPNTNARRELLKKLEQLDAKIEFIEDAYLDAERKTGVEIALIYINKQQSVEESIFEQTTDKANDGQYSGGFEEKASQDLVHGDRIRAIVQRYNHQREQGVNTIMSFYKQSAEVRGFLSLRVSEAEFNQGTLTQIVKASTNAFLRQLRHKTWMDMMDDPALTKFLTSAAKKRYRKELLSYSDMDVTERNIRAFVVSISQAYPEELKKTILDLFDSLTSRHAWYPETANNVHYFNGWASNKAHKINHRVVMPHFNLFDNYSGKISHYMPCGLTERLDDIEKVISYFDGGRVATTKLSDAIFSAMKNGQSRAIESDYFIASFFKKGTLHLTFRNRDVLRRFNIFCGAAKSWIPPNYGKKSYAEMSPEEHQVVQAFEGKDDYKVDPMVDPITPHSHQVEQSCRGEPGQTLQLEMFACEGFQQ